MVVQFFSKDEMAQVNHRMDHCESFTALVTLDINMILKVLITEVIYDLSLSDLLI